jgi:hemerythrin-like metal-binding protein
MAKKLIIWSEAYSVGILEIDKQHMRLIDLINELYNLYLEKNYEGVNDIVYDIRAYTNYHFGTEEKYFREKKYTLAEEHIKIHEAFIIELNALVEDSSQAPLILTLKIMTFLQKWLTHHILQEDKKYMGYLK